jgi:hypothetical protein
MFERALRRAGARPSPTSDDAKNAFGIALQPRFSIRSLSSSYYHVAVKLIDLQVLRLPLDFGTCTSGVPR